MHSAAHPVLFAGAFASRAIARPIRFAAEPPPHKLPVNPAQPTASASQPTMVRSTAAAAGPVAKPSTF